MNSSTNPPNLWDWLYRCMPMERDPLVAAFLRGMRLIDLKRRYYEVPTRVPGPVALWLLRMIGVYHNRFPTGEIPDNYPVGHKFERIADIRTANFQSKGRSAMNETAQAAPWQYPITGLPNKPATSPRAMPPMDTALAIATAEQQLNELKAKAKEEAKASREAERVAAEGAEAARVKQELTERLQYELALASATAELIRTVAGIELNGATAGINRTFAKFRTELAPLAETYGYRIVLVGDKSVAVLTK